MYSTIAGIVRLEQLEALVFKIGFLNEHHHAAKDADTQFPRHRPIFFFAANHRPSMNCMVGIKPGLNECVAKPINLV